MAGFDNLVARLRAIAEPTRLRILRLLAPGELTVSELTEVLGQSQPRVSRHLRLLAEAGLVERTREDHSAFYRLGADPLVDRLLGALAADDPALAADTARRAAALAARIRRATNRLAERVAVDEGMAPTVGTVLEDELRQAGLAESGLVGSGQRPQLGALLDVGTGAGHLLRTLAPLATSATGLDSSTDALQLARGQVHGAGLTSCRFRRGSMYRLPFTDQTFDTVSVSRVLAAATEPTRALGQMRRVLRPGGHLVLIEDLDALAPLQDVAHPLAIIRAWLRAAQFDCVRLHPLDTEAGHHLVIVIARVPDSQKVAA